MPARAGFEFEASLSYTVRSCVKEKMKGLEVASVVKVLDM